MNGLRLRVSSNLLTYDFTLYRRFSVIKGDSGTGKTTFVELVSAEIEGVEVDCDYPIVVVSPTTWKIIFNNTHDSVLIFDDLEIVESGEFAKLCKDKCVQNNLYIVVIAREHLGAIKKLSYSVDAIYKLVQAPNKEYILEKYLYQTYYNHE